MMTLDNIYEYSIYCLDEHQWIRVPGYHSSDPTICPNDIRHTVLRAVRTNDIRSDPELKIYMNPIFKGPNNPIDYESM